MATVKPKSNTTSTVDSTYKVESVQQDEEITGAEVYDNADILDAAQPDGDPYVKRGEKYSQEAIDALEQSVEKQVAAMGRATGELLKKEKRHKTLIPLDKLNPHDGEVIVGLNGFNLQIKKNVPVMLPGAIIDLLEEGGYNPTLVR